MKNIVKNILVRFKSPVVWLSILAIIYNVVASEIDFLPDWSIIVGYITVAFGVANNPTDLTKF